MLVTFEKKVVSLPEIPATTGSDWSAQMVSARMAVLLFLNAAHVVSMDVRCVSTDAHDLVISLVNGREWVLPYSESWFNQTGFNLWRAYEGGGE